MIQELKELIHIRYMKKNISFSLSAICFSLLVFYPEKIWLTISILNIVFAVFLSIAFKSVFSTFRSSQLYIKITAVMSAILLSYFSARHFFSMWLPSNKFFRLASTLHLTNTVLLAICASVMAVLALLYISLLFNLIFAELRRIIIETIHFTKPASMLSNLKANAVLIISAFAFMGLNIQLRRSGLIALIVSFALIIFVFSQINNIVYKIKTIPIIINVYSIVSSIGVCYFTRITFVEYISSSSFIKQIFLRTGINHNVFLRWFSAIVALFACISIFVLISLLLNFVINQLKNLFQSLSKVEIMIFSLITIILLTFVCLTFIRSNAFWGTDYVYDIIYTSDTPTLVNGNAYLRLLHEENDLRQPLFAVFAAPFIGFGYALSVPLSQFSPVFTPLFMNLIQVTMLVAANLMIAKMLNLTSSGRICFMLLSSVTYTTLLFSIMMEQYVVAYFWLIFVIYSYVENKKADVISLTAAGGTLLTSMVLLPTAYSHSEKSLRKFVTSIEKSILGFVFVFFAFGRLDVLLNFSDNTTQLAGFTGGENLFGRINQYLSFVSSCFIAPDALVDTVKYKHISWQLSSNTANYINPVGIIIFAVCIISFILNRKNILTKISFLWVCFSVLLLCVVGWGSAENGMILYSLYFGWAFSVLLFQLILWVSEKLRLKMLITIVSGLLFVTLIIFNYPGTRDLINFAFTYYPL